MALCMRILLPTKVAAMYSHISAVTAYPQDRVVDVTVSSYLDQTSRVDGAVPLTAWSGRLTYQQTGLREPTLQSIYTALKKLPYWAQANDC